MKEGLEYIALSSVCKVQNGFAFNSKLFNETNKGLPLIRIRDIKRGYSLTYTDEACSNDFYVEDGDMLIGMDGDFNIGEWKGGHALLNQRVCKLIPSDKILAKFIFYFIPEALQRINDKTAFSTVKHLSSKQVNAILLPNLPLSEQQSIVDYLDSAFAKIDAMKANAEKNLNEAKALFQASLKEMLEPKEWWEEKKLKEICETITDFVAAGSFASLRENVVYKNEKDYAQLVRTTDLKSGFSKGGCVYVNEHAFEYLYRVNLDKECIILPNVGVNCGEVYYVTPSILPYNNNVLGPNAVLVRSNNNNNHFLSYLFLGKDFQNKLSDITSHMAQPKFNKTSLKEIVVLVPPHSEQQSIVATLDSLKSKVDRLQANYDRISQECDALKQSILRQVFE